MNNFSGTLYQLFKTRAHKGTMPLIFINSSILSVPKVLEKLRSIVITVLFNDSIKR